MNQVQISLAELPEALQIWLEGQGAVLVAIQRRDTNIVELECLPDIDPSLIARVRVTMAKYREALMNLT